MVVVFTWFAAVSIFFGKILNNCGVLDCCHIVVDLVHILTVCLSAIFPDNG